MPVHAFISVWLGSLTGHQAIIQSWKEVLLLGLAASTAILVWRDRSRLERLRQPWVILGAALLALGLLVTALTTPGLTTTAFGLKTDFEFLLAAVIATTVSTKPFLASLLKIILIGAAVVSGFDLLQIFLLPPDFLANFGYGPATILPYQHIAEGTTALRFPSTIGGPNQLGTYLILPLCLSAGLFIRRRRWWQLALFASCLVSLIFTFSRSAWIGAALAVVLTIVATIPAKWQRGAAIGGGVLLVTALALTPVILSHGGPLQYYILHSSVQNHDQAHLSDSQHASSLEFGIRSLISQPLGHGLGTAGPSTFHAGTINIIENYYLQLGYEMGLLGLVLFAALLISLLFAVRRRLNTTPLAVPTVAAIIGISLVALVLPAWVDSTTAIIVWITAGAVAGGSHV